MSEAFDETTAAALAKAQGQRVEVLRLRTETDQVFRNPGGTTTREQHLEPVRVRRDTAWVPVDSTLTRAGDGSLVPTASTVAMRFSPGGTGPLVTVGRDGVALSLTWPTPLPVPTVNGDTATYSEVYPGVDLVMTAVGTSFTQHMVVKSAVAAKHPSVRSLRLGSSVTGGKLVAQSTGGFQVVDRRGHAVWSSPAPLMWDSGADAAAGAIRLPGDVAAAPDAVKPRDSQDGPREGDKAAVMAELVSADSLLITPDAAMLDSATTRYPVTIDPTVNPAIYNWAMVNKTFPTTSYYNFTDVDQGVGYNAYSGIHTKRTFFAFATSSYLGKTIQSATFSAFETYSATCAAGTVDAYLTNNFAYGMTWNTQPLRVGGIQDSFSTKAGRSDCNAGGIRAEFDVKVGVQSRATDRYAVTTFGLVGRSETTDSSWMRFAGPKNTTIDNRPKLSVEYNSTPSIPSTAKMFAPDTATACGTTLATSKKFNQTSSTAYLNATGADPDGGTLRMVFSLYNALTGQHQNDNVIGPIVTTSSLGVQFRFKVPATWGDGSYYWISRVTDGLTTSAFSGRCYITLDKTAPPKPLVTSATFVQDTLAPSGTPVGVFTMAAVGATSFNYYWNGNIRGNLPVNSTSSGAPAWTGDMVIPAATAVNYLQAIAVDGAGNQSPISAEFYLKKAVGGKLAQYLFNDPMAIDNGPSVATDTATEQPALTTDPIITGAEAPYYVFDLNSTGVARDTGRFVDLTGPENRSLLFGATGEEAISDQRPVVSERSFTIGAWVKLTDDSASRTVVAQNLEAAPVNPDAAVAAYDIGYDQVTDKFVFTVTPTVGLPITATDALPSSVTNSATGEVIVLPHAGAWVYLAAIYDQNAGTIRLDALHEANPDPLDSPSTENLTTSRGVAKTLTAGVGVKAGMGAFRVGDGAVSKSPWAGMVDNVSVWQQALTDGETDNAVHVNATNRI